MNRSMECYDLKIYKKPEHSLEIIEGILLANFDEAKEQVAGATVDMELQHHRNAPEYKISSVFLVMLAISEFCQYF